MSEQNLDKIIQSIRNEKVDDATVKQAAKRVFPKVFNAAFLPEHVHHITGCSDFQALIPSYLEGSLPPARIALLEDHVSACVDCRRVLRERRTGVVALPRETAKLKPRVPWLPLAIAASLAVGIGIGVTGALNGLLPGQHAVRGTVLSVQGALYRVSDIGASLVEAGAVITNADELRTAKGSRAIIRLVDGPQVEVAERSEVSVSRDWRGDQVHLQRGQMIVAATVPHRTALYVTAGDVSVPVRNAVFAVNRGIKGARIAVAQGSADVQENGRTQQVGAGQLITADYRVRTAPLGDEFSWSANASHYLALLSELSAVQKQLQAIPSPGVRFSSSLMQDLPENTVLYAAIPNLAGTIAEAKRIFDEHLAQNDVLRQWWQQQPASRNGALDKALTQIGSISQFLGDEVVLTVFSNGKGHAGSPVLLARVKSSGLREYIQSNVPADAGVRIVDASGNLDQRKGSLLIALDNGMVLASPDAAALQQVRQIVMHREQSTFPKTGFGQRITQSYEKGAEYLLALDVEQLLPKSVSTQQQAMTGFENARYLVLERSTRAGKTDTKASLSFAGQRAGVASWLGAPGPMGSLDFVSPDASFAVSFVMKNPRSVMQELVSFASRGNPNDSQHVQEMQDKLGINLADDFAAPFEGDMTIAMDGPLVPIPAWKVAADVTDPARLQSAVTQIVDRFNQFAGPDAGKLRLNSEKVNDRTFYSLLNDKAPNFAVYYTFVDNFLLAGPSKANLQQAIQNRASGYTLTSSSKFRSELPDDGYINCSAILYNNVVSQLGSVAKQVKGTVSLPKEQQQALSALLADSEPGVVCVYGEPNRIVASSSGSFLGFNLGMLAQMAQGRPPIGLIASNARTVMSDSLNRANTRN